MIHQTILSTYRIIKFTSYKQYLVGLLFSEKPMKTHSDQSTLQVFHSVWKEKAHKPLKAATAKNVSSVVYVIGTTCFNKCFYSIW